MTKALDFCLTLSLVDFDIGDIGDDLLASAKARTKPRSFFQNGKDCIK